MEYHKKNGITMVKDAPKLKINKYNKKLIVMNSLLLHETIENLVIALVKKTWHEPKSLREGLGQNETIHGMAEYKCW